MGKILRLQAVGDNTLQGWQNSTKYSTTAIDQIADPNGGSASKQITSIPSPFARIELVKTAFKIVSEKDVNGKYINIDGSTTYNEMVSHTLDVGQIFYEQRDIIAYDALGIGRLIYQLPVNLCRMFIQEIFGDDIPKELDDEMLMTVNKFYNNNLNVSETARQMYVHRNTLVYRIERLREATGLDIRTFDDALTLKIALMVVNYTKYLDEQMGD